MKPQEREQIFEWDQTRRLLIGARNNPYAEQEYPLVLKLSPEFQQLINNNRPASSYEGLNSFMQPPLASLFEVSKTQMCIINTGNCLTITPLKPGDEEMYLGSLIRNEKDEAPIPNDLVPLLQRRVGFMIYVTSSETVLYIATANTAYVEPQAKFGENKPEDFADTSISDWPRINSFVNALSIVRYNYYPELNAYVLPEKSSA